MGINGLEEQGQEMTVFNAANSGSNSSQVSTAPDSTAKKVGEFAKEKQALVNEEEATRQKIMKEKVKDFKNNIERLRFSTELYEKKNESNLQDFVKFSKEVEIGFINLKAIEKVGGKKGGNFKMELSDDDE